MATQVDLSRLVSVLNRTGLAKDNNSLYQVIKGLIDFIQKNFTSINLSISSGSSGGSGGSIIQTIGPPGLDGIDGEDGLSIPGPIGSAGIQGPQGQDGQIIFLEDSIEPDFIPALVGPQGNPGPTGSQGPVGGYFPIEDGLDGEDGFPGPPGINGSNSNVLLAQATLDSVAINSLNSVPYTLVATPGGDLVIVPVWIIFWVTRSANAFSASPSFRIRWNSIATSLSTDPTFSLNVAGAGETFRDLARTAINFGFGGSDPRNKALELSASANTTGGSGASLRVSVLYYLASWS